MFNPDSNIVITGGAGFIGCNLADALLQEGLRVQVVDNLARTGVRNNLAWLKARHGEGLTFHRLDVRDGAAVKEVLSGADVIFHLAAQVAVTTSVREPRTDFEVNAIGTLNVLEAARLSGRKPFVLYTSTNKVYGELEHMAVVEGARRYRFKDCVGVAEDCPLDFHSPYGCSKGAADQYVRDYARIYGLATVVFRMSCIYGTRQFGSEDQGWLAHFLISLAMGRPITIYGNGKQVRDLLFVEDLVVAMKMAYMNREKTIGQIYNIGGGPGNTVSIWLELRNLLEKICGRKLDTPAMSKRRPGDQPLYISDIAKAARDFGWKPEVTVAEGVGRLHRWVAENQDLFA